MFPLSDILTIEKMTSDRLSCGTSNLFGIIVYTDEHPYIKKMLRDTDYWESLNARTKGWLIYAVRPGDNSLGVTEDYLLPLLDIQDSGNLPQLILITPTPDNHFLQRNYPIDDTNVETAYKSLQSTVDKVTAAVAKINAQDRDGVDIHKVVTDALDHELAKQRWKRVSFPFLGLIREIVGLVI